MKEFEKPDISSNEAIARRLPHRTKSLRKEYLPSWRRALRMLLRCLALCFKFGPVLAVSPLLVLAWPIGGEDAFWSMFLGALESAGPTFVKLAQWASTRPDLLPQTVTRRLSRLQAGVRPHSLEDTRRQLEEDFGEEWPQYISIGDRPIGSGCMGQVYFGKVTHGGREQEVAVKVLHPSSRAKIDLDLEIMHLAAHLLSAAWKRIALLSITEFVVNFEAFIVPQSDMRAEAENMREFNINFAYASTGKGLKVNFPNIIQPFVSESVLVMTYEKGIPLSEFLEDSGELRDAARFETQHKKTPLQIQDPAEVARFSRHVGRLVIDTFIQMLFVDHVVHGDLHPGNIMVRIDERSNEPELVVFDVGLAVRMNARDRKNFVDLLYAVAKRDGELVARLMVERSPGDRSKVVDEEGFVRSVGDLVNRVRSQGLKLGNFGLGQALAQLVQLAFAHQVKLETSFVTIVTSIGVVEGVGRQLEPDVDIIEAATPHLIKAAASYLLRGA